MLPRKNSDDVSGELLARGYWRMLGHLSEQEISWLSEMVIERCRWFPTVVECRDLMAEPSYANRFHVARRTVTLDRLGYAPLLIENKNVAGGIDAEQNEAQDVEQLEGNPQGDTQ